jgi:predicted DNA-binding transcriptional regulator YafY
MKDVLGAPIENQRGYGYSYNNTKSEYYELPGLWFSEKEITSLGVINQLNESLQPASIREILTPIQQRIDFLLSQQQITKTSWQSRIKIINQCQRYCESEFFELISYALLHRNRLKISYWNWLEDKERIRIISPQRLVFYRGNWYLDAWCHLRDAIRTFSVDSIKSVKLQRDKSAKDISYDVLEQHVSGGYGIFSGFADKTATLKFSVTVSRRVSKENWHPKQEAKWSDKGEYILDVPYSDHRELIRDILSFGSEVEVLGPASLCELVKVELTKNLEIYSETLKI